MISAAEQLTRLAERFEALESDRLPVAVMGRVINIAASSCLVSGISRFVHVGDLVQVTCRSGQVLCVVLTISAQEVAIKPLADAADIALGNLVRVIGPLVIRPHEAWRGQVLDALARPWQNDTRLALGHRPVAVHQAPPDPLLRPPISKQVLTGVRALDSFVPLCLGQRIGIFAGSGVGKSTLMSMLACAAGFDAVVVALVGERGREVNGFLKDTLGSAAARAVTIVSTGDETALMRKLAAMTAMTVAEFFRDRGQNVLLLVDSITRFAQSCREVALAAGELPVSRGFPPSVFGDLQRLLERAGPSSSGSITAVFSVLVDGDDHNDPVADAARGMLDGHVVLERSIADGGRYPAIDLLASISRLAHVAWTQDIRRRVLEARALMHSYETTRDLRAMGAYTPGGDAELDRAVRLVPRLYQWLTQYPGETTGNGAAADMTAILES